MKKLLHAQKGFSVIELLLVIIVLCLLVVIGYLVFMLKGQPTSSTHQNSSTSRASQAAGNTAAEADIVNRANYVIHYDADNHGPDVPQQLHDAGYFTQKLVDYINQQNNASPVGAGEDLIICAQASPESVSFGTPVIASDGTTAALTITGNYNGSGSNDIATNWVKVNGVWQEDVIACSNR